MNKNKVVSIVIPTRNSARFLENCLRSIRKQTYKDIEVIIVDSNSKDSTLKLAKKYRTIIYNYVPKIKTGTFEGPYKRNYGVKKSTGEYVYYLDADMELTPNVLSEAVQLVKKGLSAVIIPEDSFGIGIWARAKNLERRCYWGDDTVEAPRFFKKKVWIEIGGLDESLGGGGDDWDLSQKLIENNYKIGRIKSLIKHNEGNLKLASLMKKRFMYGKDALKYFSKRPQASLVSYFPIRWGYVKNIGLFLHRPLDAAAFIIMRSSEYLAGFAGVVYSFLKKDEELLER